MTNVGPVPTTRSVPTTSPVRTIGLVTEDDIVAEARRWRAAVGAGELDDVRGLDDLRPWTHADLKAAAVAQAATTGGLVVCSGGTTGTPKLTVIATDQGIPRMLPSWRPLWPGDVLLNLFSLGRMWGAHYFYNALATHCSSIVAPMGPLHAEEFGEWAGIIADLGITALAGAPNVLARFAESVRELGIELPVRAVIWSGEPMTPARQAAIRTAFPHAGLWGNYGSIETFVIGVSGPDCRSGALHLLPDQLLELDGGGALLTRVGAGWPVPVVRFRLGDRIRPADCPCGRNSGFEVIGRTDDSIKLYGAMVEVGDVLSKAAQIPGIGEAQVAVYRDPEAPSAAVGICLRYTGGNVDPAEVRADLISRVEDLEIVNRHAPEAFEVRHMAEVERNPRTNKVLPMLWCDWPAGDATAVEGG